MKRTGIQKNLIADENSQFTASLSKKLKKVRPRDDELKKDDYSQRDARKEIEYIMGSGKVISKVLKYVEDYAQQDEPLLIEGETGVGKQEIAKYLHSISPRRNKELVIFDCGATTESLTEAELFGSKKGAYTDSKEDRAGIIEAAKGGTLFLDEINSFPIKLQPKLLHLIQEREYKRVGDEKYIKADVRVIAASNENLKDLVKKGLFRKDLFYRIVGKITIPPLREREEDIDFFINRFIKEKADKLKKAGVHIDEDVRDLLRNYTWEGNVRELINVIHELVTHVKQDKKTKIYIINSSLIKECDLLKIEHSENKVTYEDDDYTNKNADIIKKMKLIERAMKKAGGNVKEAIKLIGISRSTFYRWKKEIKEFLAMYKSK
ncbi:MAG: sigma 54-interacting transcriptional regulator [Bacteroidales bacterium]|jgi:transcriptional regulator with PAS, ATPase and Fis domain|nr:sigma 54-interacting transcriptional regulator [Bacteroidales bacterium]